MVREKVFIVFQRTGVLKILKCVVPRRVKYWLNRFWGRGESCWKLADGSVVHYPTDFYWLNYTDVQTYEPEMWEVVVPLLDERTLFIDGGANIGLWSAVAATRIGRPGQVIAVEASKGILPWLRRNCECNKVGFEIMDQAIWSADNADLVFHEHVQHAGSSLVGARVGSNIARADRVKTVTVDSIVANAFGFHPTMDKIVVKLDVEGSEIDAFRGSRNAIEQRNILFIYEEIGEEKSSETTRFLLAETNLNLYYNSDLGSIRINELSEVDAIKVDPKKGYNFFATVPGTELDRIMSGA